MHIHTVLNQEGQQNVKDEADSSRWLLLLLDLWMAANAKSPKGEKKKNV